MAGDENGLTGNEKILPGALSLAITVMRQCRGLRQLDLARRVGYSSTAISYLECGKRVVQPRVLLKIATALRFSREEVEALLFGLSAFLGAPDSLPADTGLAPAELEEIARRAMKRGLTEARDSLQRLIVEAQAQRKVAEREDATRRYREIAGFPLLQQEALLETRTELQTWAMVERLCEESAKAATDEPKRALALGNLALRCAHSPGIPIAFRSRLEGYAWAFIANARRVGSDLPGAQEAFRLAWESWRRARRGANELPLGAWRIQDLEASLKREQFRLRGALALLARALRAAPTSAKGRLLLKKATTYMVMSQPARAIAVLQEAHAWVTREHDASLYLALRFNLAVNLEMEDRIAEAGALLGELREVATQLRSEVSLLRVSWLQARIQAKLGDRDESIGGLETVLREFAARKLAHDAAQAALELATLLIEEGQFERVQGIAAETAWVFRAQRVEPRVLAALRVFYDALERETLTLQVAKSALNDINRARLLRR